MIHKKICIVDDEIKVRNIFKKELNELGFITLEAKNGSDALVLLNRTPDVDLLLLDLLIPNEKGDENFLKIKESFPRLKIVISSVFSRDEQENLVRSADGYYCKTESFSVLNQIIKDALRSEKEIPAPLSEPP